MVSENSLTKVMKVDATGAALSALSDAAGPASTFASGMPLALRKALSTLLAGHPILMSQTSAPIASTTWAASPIRAGSDPYIWMAIGRSLSTKCSILSVLGRRRVRPSLEMNSIDTSPHPPIRRISNRKSRSVMPAMGARISGGSTVTAPMCSTLEYNKPLTAYVVPGTTTASRERS